MPIAGKQIYWSELHNQKILVETNYKIYFWWRKSNDSIGTLCLMIQNCLINIGHYDTFVVLNFFWKTGSYTMNYAGMVIAFIAGKDVVIRMIKIS